WRRLQLFWANTDAKAIRCFAKNRTEDAQIPKQGPSGEIESDIIRLEDMQGNITAYPEVDAQYPTLQADIRSLMLNLWNGANPLFEAVAQDPRNLEYIFRVMGATDLQVPGEDQRKKTYKDIEQLLQEMPQQGAPTPENPQGSFIPSVLPDPDVDNLKVAQETAKSWLISEAGMDAKTNNPAGYENVKAYAKACDQLQKMILFKAALATGGVQGQGPAADLGGSQDVGQQPQGPVQ
ncbi:MAG: hypothetical protein ACRD2L_11670, partial [Terriglobia bacterium]